MDISQVSFKISGSAGKASESLGKLITRLEQLDTAFTKVVGSGNATITMLNGITGALSASASQAVATDGAISGLTASVKSLSNTSKGLNLPTIKLSRHTTATKSATTITKKLGKSLTEIGTNAHHTMGKLGKLVRTLSQLTFVTILTRQALVGVSTGFRAAINYTENLNLFMVALGENTTRAMGFVKEMSESFYLDEAQLTRTLGLFYQISESLGLSSVKAYTLSTNFTKLAYDLASFYNISVDNAVTKLQAGLVGETEPLRRIGIIITENNLAETARNLGIRKSIRNMTEQEKIQLRYVTALQQTQNAQSDLARTMKQPENLLRIFNEQWQVLIRNLGSSFLPMLQQVMPHVIGITKALADMLKKFAEMRGYVAPMVRDDLGGYSKVVADESEKQAKSTSKTAKELGKILKYTRDISSATTGIDELNILGEKGGTTFDIGNLFETEDDTKASIDIPLPDYDSAMGKAKDTFKKYVEMYDKKIRELWGKFRTTFDTSFEAFEELKKSIKTIDFSDMDISVWDILNGLVTGVLKGITDIIEFGKRLYKEVFKPIMDLVAPKWMKSLEDGSFAEAVEKIFLIFVGYKALDTIIGIAKHLGKISAIIGTIAVLVATGVFDDTKNALNELWASITGEDISLDEAVDGVRTALDIIDNVLAGVIKGMKDLVDIGKSLYKAVFKPIMDLVAPKWMESLEDGSFAEAVEKIFKLFVSYKVLETLTGKTGHIGGKTGLLASFAAMGAIQLGFDINEAVNTGQWEELGKNLMAALLAGLGVGIITGSGPLACITIPIVYSIGKWLGFGKPSLPDPTTMTGLLTTPAPTIPPIPTFTPISTTLSEKTPQMPGGHHPSPGNTARHNYSTDDLIGDITDILNVTKQKDLWQKIYDFASIEENANRMLSGLKGTSMSATDIENAFVRLYFEGAEFAPPELPQPIGLPRYSLAVPLFAKGGTPERGNLFVAGEKGPELVTEHNGETVVMNEQQLKDRGISLYADGVNIPAEGESKKPLGELSDASPFDFVNDFNKATDKVKGKLLDFGDLFSSGTSIINTVYNEFKKLAEFGVGALLNAFNKFADSKSFQTLFKDGPAEGGTTKQQQAAMGDIIGSTLGDGPAGQIFALAQHIADGTVGKFLESAPMMIDAGMDFLMNLLDGVVKALPAILQALPKVIRKMVEVLSNPETIKTIIQAVIDIVDAIVVALPDIISALVMAIPTVISALIDALIDLVVDPNTWKMLAKIGANLGIGIAQGAANLVIAGLNLLITVVELPFRWLGIKFPRIPEADFSGLMFAEGGFPNEGQMFIAREAGAELVGNIGGSTAVANNDQIVTAVSDGVYRAVSMAMSEQGGQRVSLRVDGRRMSEAMDLASKKRGLAFGTGGY